MSVLTVRESKEYLQFAIETARAAGQVIYWTFANFDSLNLNN